MPYALHHGQTGSGARSRAQVAMLLVIKIAPTLARPGLFGD